MDIANDDDDIVEIIELDNDQINYEKIKINENNDEAGEAVSASYGVKFTSSIRSLSIQNQLLATEELRSRLLFAGCTLVYNPRSSYASNLAQKINSIDIEAFNKNVQTLENLIVMGNAVARVYKNCNSLEWLTHIIKKTVELEAEPSKDLEKLYFKLWKMKKETNFPPAIVKLVVLTYPAVLEDFVIELVTKCTEIDQAALQNHLAQVFNKQSVKTWLNICSKCPQMFQITCSMIQTLLHFSRGDKKVLAFAETFHRSVRDRSKQFHQLYPVHLQPLVRRMQTRKLDDERVLHELADLMVAERSACQTLLTCFPAWLPRLLVFAAKHHAASIISEEFGDWHD